MRFVKLTSLFAPTLLALAAGCAMETSEPGGGSGDQTIPAEDLVKPEEGKADSSVQAVIVDFEWDGEAVVDSVWNVESTVEDQLLYTIGHLNAEHSVGRLDKLELTNVKTTDVDGKKKITYHAKMPVAWGEKNNVPTSYKLRIPRDASYSGYDAFTKKYKDSCVDAHAHDVDSGSMWYYFRPEAYGCQLEDTDVYTATASVKVSTVNTTGKYPEYTKVWEDNVFKTVAIFGKYEDGATSSSDAGIAAYNEFVNAVKSKLGNLGLTTVPASVPGSPGVANPDIQFNATLADGKKVEIYALLVDNVRTAGPTFDDRYESLSTTADFVVYNGHAGLGANIRALAQKGKWVKGQYVIFFENGCDSYAYVDSEIWKDHAAVNPDDPTGTKHVDMVINAMPAYFHSDAEATMAFVNGLISHEQPKTYEQIFRDVDSSQVILVTGEEDNVFVPGGGGGGNPDPAWAGMTESGSVAKSTEKRFTTPKLPKGSYRFDMTGTGDADLYVRVGSAPTKTLYDCRPYKAGSKESCTVKLNTDAPVHVMVRGWAASSSFKLVGARQ
ncbi:MAG: PPC domain-containing protein [Polyangiaceae bacterium]|nr:PPC domain-containing protein [Polyangiaceae bacterium]